MLAVFYSNCRFLQFFGQIKDVFSKQWLKNCVKNLLALFTVLIRAEQSIWHHNLLLWRHCQTSVELRLCTSIISILFEVHIYGKFGICKGVFTTLSNIYEKLLRKIVNRFQQLNVFAKNLHNRCSTRFEIRL